MCALLIGHVGGGGLCKLLAVSGQPLHDDDKRADRFLFCLGLRGLRTWLLQHYAPWHGQRILHGLRNRHLLRRRQRDKLRGVLGRNVLIVHSRCGVRHMRSRILLSRWRLFVHRVLCRLLRGVFRNSNLLFVS